MMKNADKPAAPTFTHDVKADLPLHKTDNAGLTKREMFAMHAMQGILSSIAQDEIGYDKWEKTLAEHSVKAADALLAELEK